MAKNYVSTGSQHAFLAPAGGVTSGKPIKIGALTLSAKLIESKIKIKITRDA